MKKSISSAAYKEEEKQSCKFGGEEEVEMYPRSEEAETVRFLVSL